MTTCSAGNHAQGVALTCNELNIKHNIFVQLSTPKQKIEKIKQFCAKLNPHWKKWDTNWCRKNRCQKTEHMYNIMQNYYLIKCLAEAITIV